MSDIGHGVRNRTPAPSPLKRHIHRQAAAGAGIEADVRIIRADAAYAGPIPIAAVAEIDDARVDAHAAPGLGPRVDIETNVAGRSKEGAVFVIDA